MKTNKKKMTLAAKSASKKSGPKKAGSKGKAPAKKAVPSKPSAKMIQMLDTLKKLAGGLNEADLNTLVRQARILIHNREVLNSVTRHKAALAGKERYDKNVQFKEAGDLSYFLITFYNYQNFFSRLEMKKIVKMCHAAKNSRDAAGRLYNWFASDRSDVLKNTGLDSAGDPVLVVIYDHIMNNYTIKA